MSKLEAAAKVAQKMREDAAKRGVEMTQTQARERVREGLTRSHNRRNTKG